MRGIAIHEPWHGDDDDAPARFQQPRYCAHDHLRLIEPARRVFCRDCQQEVDAFTALMGFTVDFERWVSHRERVEQETRRARAQLEEVKRELRNAKARLRRAQA